jgi:hypothetical protein
MAYKIVTAGDRIVELFNDDYLAPPATAVPISDAEGQALAEGGFAAWRYIGGAVVRAPIAPATPAQLHATIDAAAGAARARYITVAAGQEATYLLKDQQARAYKAAGYPFATLASYAYVQAEAMAINGATPTAAQTQAAADAIINQADAWLAKGAQIEQQRITGKRAVTAAADAASAQAACDAAVVVLAAC